MNLHKLWPDTLLPEVTWQTVAHFIARVERNNLGGVLIKIITELGGLRAHLHTPQLTEVTRVEYIQQLLAVPHTRVNGFKLNYP
jgi:hypothetical protein